MSTTLELMMALKESFYTKEWITSTAGYVTQIKNEPDFPMLWIGNGSWFFTGYNCSFHIPLWLRGYMWYHYRKGRMTKNYEKYYTILKGK